MKVIKVLLVMVLLIAGFGYVALFYTALPARAVFGMVEKLDPHWAFDDVTGTFSRGFTIGTLSYTHPEDPARVSTIKNMGFEYENTSEAIIITSIHLEAAHLYISPGETSYEETVTGGDDSFSMEESTDPVNGPDYTTGNEPLDDQASDSIVERYLAKKWIVKEIRINDLTIEDPLTQEQTTIEKFESDGFMVAGETFLLGRLVLSSNNVDIDIIPTGDLAEGKYGSAIDIRGRIGEKLHWALKKDIEFTGSVDFTGQPALMGAFEGFGGAIRITGKDAATQKVTLTNFSFDDYFEHESVPPIRALTLDAAYRSVGGEKVALDIGGGHFTLGHVLFTVKQTTIDLTDTPGGNRELKARASSSNVDYTLTLTSEGEAALHFSSEPPMEEEDILATLVYGAKFNALVPENKANISSWLR